MAEDANDVPSTEDDDGHPGPVPTAREHSRPLLAGIESDAETIRTAAIAGAEAEQAQVQPEQLRADAEGELDHERADEIEGAEVIFDNLEASRQVGRGENENSGHKPIALDRIAFHVDELDRARAAMDLPMLQGALARIAAAADIGGLPDIAAHARRLGPDPLPAELDNLIGACYASASPLRG